MENDQPVRMGLGSKAVAGVYKDNNSLPEGCFERRNVHPLSRSYLVFLVIRSFCLLYLYITSPKYPQFLKRTVERTNPGDRAIPPVSVTASSPSTAPLLR